MCIRDSSSFTIGGVTVDGISVLTLLMTALIMVVLSFFINKTKLGKAMRDVYKRQ